MAACGARAAARADAAHRRAHDHALRTIRNFRPASRRSCRGCSNWAGPSAATCGSTSVGPQAMPTAFASTRRNWSRSRRTSSWPLAASTVGPLLQATRTVPIVFAVSHRSGRRRLRRELGAAGRQRHRVYHVRIRHEREMAGAAQRDRAGRDASGGPSGSHHRRPGLGQFGAIQAVAPSFGVEVSPINVRDAGEIERAVAAFARSSNGGLIVTASALALVHRDLIITLAARHRLPAVYSDRFFVTGGGLISYGPDHRRPVPARGRLRRSHPQGREAGRPAGAGADQVRAGDQPQDRQGARPRRAAIAARPRRRGDRMKRREFITLLGGAAAAWPLAARAQQSERMRRIGVLMGSAADDPEAQARNAALPAGPAAIGLDRRPQRADRRSLGRWRCRPLSQICRGTGRACAGRHPHRWPLTWRRCSRRPASCRSCSRGVTDPVGAGLVDSLARPGGNATGFIPAGCTGNVHFGTLERNGTGDFDGDGISDMDEYLNGTDPTQGNSAPTAPTVLSPVEGSEVVAIQPGLIVSNSVDPDGNTIAYIFEILIPTSR